MEAVGGSNELFLPILMISSIVIVIGAGYFGVLKIWFGTWTLKGAVQRYKSGKKDQSDYASLYDKRETIIYHMDWAKVSEILALF